MQNLVHAELIRVEANVVIYKVGKNLGDAFKDKIYGQLSISYETGDKDSDPSPKVGLYENPRLLKFEFSAGGTHLVSVNSVRFKVEDFGAEDYFRVLADASRDKPGFNLIGPKMNGLSLENVTIALDGSKKDIFNQKMPINWGNVGDFKSAMFRLRYAPKKTAKDYSDNNVLFKIVNIDQIRQVAMPNPPEKDGVKRILRWDSKVEVVKVTLDKNKKIEGVDFVPAKVSWDNYLFAEGILGYLGTREFGANNILTLIPGPVATYTVPKMSSEVYLNNGTNFEAAATNIDLFTVPATTYFMDASSTVRIRPDATHMKAPQRLGHQVWDFKYDPKLKVQTLLIEDSYYWLTTNYKVTNRLFDCGLRSIAEIPTKYRVVKTSKTNFKNGKKGNRFFGIMALRDVRFYKAGDIVLMPSVPYGSKTRPSTAEGWATEPITPSFVNTGHNILIEKEGLGPLKDDFMGLSVAYSSKEDMKANGPNKLKFNSWTLNNRPPACTNKLNLPKMNAGIKGAIMAIYD